MKDKLDIGIIGAGGFAAFASKAFLKIEGVKIIAVTDISEPAARLLATDLNAIVYTGIDEFLDDPELDLVYISTPPFLHYEQSKKALLKGKHVICEKPAAFKSSEAEELRSLARSFKLLYVVNLMQRYSPLFSVVNTIVKTKVMGNFLHGFFENYASDENLDAGHWFWDERKSGGIFIEHGVHFFDMFSGWLGEGKLVSALQLQRSNGERIFDRVQATVLYDKGIVNFYHGFDQPNILDRQEMRLQFERGDITLYEWIPVRIKLHGLLQREQLKDIGNMLENLSVVHHTEPSVTNQKVQGRFTEIIFNDHVTIEYGNISEKQNRYRQMLTAMLQDQWDWIKDHNHIRIIDDNNAIESLRMAEKATEIAQKF
jgi:predicted dehydrogenase